MEEFQNQASAAGAKINQEDEDDVPELVAGETFEAAANETRSS